MSDDEGMKRARAGRARLMPHLIHAGAGEEMTGNCIECGKAESACIDYVVPVFACAECSAAAQQRVAEGVSPSVRRERHVYSNGVVERVVAESVEDARAILREHMGVDFSEEADLNFVQEDDTRVLTIQEFYDKTGRDKDQRTCREWADAHGRGFLCSTEF